MNLLSSVSLVFVACGIYTKPHRTFKRPLVVKTLLLVLFFAFVVSDWTVSMVYAQPVKTEIRKVGKSFEFVRADKPFFIQGVAGESRYAYAASIGANAIRIRHQALAPAALDSAAALGLSVLVTLRIPSKEEGFDPANSAQAAELIETFNNTILAHKNHPALLMWSAGFEVNQLNHGPAIWNLVNRVAKLCRALDTNHPVITTLAGVTKEDIQALKKSVPEIDALGINVTGAVDGIPASLRAWGWSRPYLLTEWGTNSDKDAPRTAWEAPIEPTSTQKAQFYLKRYDNISTFDTNLFLGSFAGYWGSWFKTTPTWSGLFLETGEALGGLDMLQSLFTKKPVTNHAPEIHAMKISASTAYDNVILGTDSEFSAWVEATDPDGDDLNYRWEIMADTFFISPPVTKPVPLDSMIVNNFGHRISFFTPENKGMYRLYVYVSDRRGKAATANIPFFVN
jgi:hypothetical protein